MDNWEPNTYILYDNNENTTEPVQLVWPHGLEAASLCSPLQRARIWGHLVQPPSSKKSQSISLDCADEQPKLWAKVTEK